MGELDGKVAIVTGGGSGIGRATVEAFVAQGAQVVVADIDADAGEEVAAGLGDAAVACPTDVSDADQVQAMVDLAVERFGGLHVMVNNAGVGSAMTGFLEDDFSDFARAVDVNVYGVMLGSQRAARHMKEHGGGSIIVNSSIAGISPGPGLISYRTTKAAVIHFSRSIAVDLGPYGIRVNCIAPAHIVTTMTNYDMDPVIRYTQPLPRPGQPDDAANAMVFLASDRSAHITGVLLPVDGGTTAGPPFRQTRLIMGQAAKEGGGDAR